MTSPTRVLAILLPTLAALSLVAPLAAQDEPVGPETYGAVKAVVERLRDEDPAGLADLVDFEARHAEGTARGTVERLWSDLDDLDRMLTAQATATAWTGDDTAFLRDARLVDVEPVADPDAGRGPVPDRIVARARLQSLRTRMVRDLLVVLTPDRRVIDLVFGEVHVDGADPAGPGGLRPTALPDGPVGDLRWPVDMIDAERESVRELVGDLLAASSADDRALVAERLHRNPRPAASALVERLVALDDEREPDADQQLLLVDTLTLITGRSSTLAAAPRAGLDLSSWRARNSAEVDAWVRWLDAHVETFVPQPVRDPLEPTLAEARAPDVGAEAPRGRWAEALAARERESAGVAQPDTPDRPRSISGRASGGNDASAEPGAGSDVPAPWRPPERKIKGLDDVARKPPREQGPGPRDLLFPAAADLELRFRGERVRGRDVEQELSPQLREALNTWAGLAAAQELEVVIGKSPDALLIGHARGLALEDASAWMDRVDEMFGSIVPVAPGRTVQATVAVLFDEKGVRTDAYTAVIDALEEQRLVFSSLAAELRGEPGGVTLRNVPLFVQLTYDVAGNAAAGDDEFRLRNEVLNKTVQCLVTNRVGQLPPAIRWGLGYVAELRETKSVYTFDVTGFVATADHFDWHVRTRQHLEKRDKRRDYRISSEPLDETVAGKAEPPQMILWAALDHLAHEEPDAFAGLLTGLADLQRQVDPRSRASTWRPGHEATAAVLAKHLDGLQPKGLIAHLKRID